MLRDNGLLATRNLVAAEPTHTLPKSNWRGPTAMCASSCTMLSSVIPVETKMPVLSFGGLQNNVVTLRSHGTIVTQLAQTMA